MALSFTAVSERMTQATGHTDRFRVLTEALAEVGFDQVNYGFFDPAAAEKLKAEVLFLSTMRSDWLSYYQDRALHLADPHVVRVRQRNLTPYVWGDAQIAALDDPDMRQAALMTREAGIGSALCVPLASAIDPLTPVAGMTLGSSQGVKVGELGLDEAFTLVTLVHQFHGLSLQSVIRQRLGVRPLSARERDCLSLAATGLRQDAIADRLGLSRATVELHLAGARRKLVARTLAEAVARAIVTGTIG